MLISPLAFCEEPQALDMLVRDMADKRANEEPAVAQPERKAKAKAAKPRAKPKVQKAKAKPQEIPPSSSSSSSSTSSVSSDSRPLTSYAKISGCKVEEIWSKGLD